MNLRVFKANKLLALLILIVASFFKPCYADQVKENINHKVKDRAKLEAITITGDEEDRKRATGSIHKIEEEVLKKWHYTDVNRVLNDVPGVYLRQEDGYGLRPNIGMRGSDSNRSKKVTLMEDGVLFAPAPYSAPAAYYFPMLSRMQSVEVYKGLSSIKFGPNSVGGAINFVSREIPINTKPGGSGEIDVSIGSYGFSQIHGSYGNDFENFGWMLEGVHMQADGFKELDMGGNTGFDKNDAVVKFRFNSDINSDVYHQLDLKIGFASEVSNETYLGLTDSDFAKNPNRRYVLSADDLMTWNHQQFNANYFFDSGKNLTVNTVLYHRRFSRDWNKMNGFTGNAPLTSEILLDPDTPLHSVYYSLLTGEESSSGPHDRVIVESKDREFISQGVQSQLDWEAYFSGYQNKLSLGFRYHEDEVKRDHTAREFEVIRGDIFERTDIAPRDTVQNQAKAQAVSIFAFNELILGDLSISAGIRSENIRTEHINYVNNIKTLLENSVVLPGVGVNYKLTDSVRLLAGVHEGFVSVPPGSDVNVAPERSINYEAGFRYSAYGVNSSVISFFSDYSNLGGTCTFSLGCAAEDIDKGFNAGEVDIWGLEVDIKKTLIKFSSTSLDVPLSLTYTFTDSEFKNSFSSPRPDLVDVKAGDKLPMLPEQQLTLKAGLSSDEWQVALAYNYVSEMRTIAGKDKPSKRNRTDAQSVVDLSFNYFLKLNKEIYFTVDNVLNDVAIVSRRPFGARPGKPRTFLLGFKMGL